MVLPCLMGAFNSIGGCCFGWIGEHISAEAAYLIAYATNIENLRIQVQNLTDAIKSVEDRIQEAENSQGATCVDAVVKRLLERMASVKEEASKIITDEERSSDSKCPMGLHPNLWACYLRSKSAKKAIDKAVELLEEEKKHVRPVANVDYLKCSGVMPIEEFEEFKSRVLVSNQIMAALRDPSVNMVGVYGMGGSGKTTLAEKIGADLHSDSTFSFVVLAIVSEKQNQHDNNYQPDLLNIQKQIAGGFKIQLQGQTLRDRAAELREQLQKKDKILIILDDIWSRFELKDVGIPIGIGNIGKKFKILMTSRSETILRKEMNSTNNFGLESLTHPDALILFDRMIGGDSHYSDWRPTAQQVVHQCGGIPIILVTIARALRNEDSKSWEDALTRLKEFEGEDIVEEAYKMIEVSYKFLKSEELKKLLLLCAQFSHRSIPVDNLLKYTIGLDLFKGCKKLKVVNDRLHKYLSDLKGCCLLQEGSGEGIVKMYDVIHRFASYVAARDHDVFSVANDGELEEWPSRDEFEQFSAISLPFCHLPPAHMLPATFDNPKLESFLMLRSQTDAPFKIPDNFFAGMKGLKLMDLTGMSLSSVLVSSLDALRKLRTLCLDQCELSDISVIGELPMLQALSLVCSSIVLVPKEIGKLGSTLKLLDLRGCRNLERIAAGVFFKLTLLEDLRIGESFITWQRLKSEEDKSSRSVSETSDTEVASLEEFKNLQNLINIEICIHDAKMFPKDLVFKKLETFIIGIGNYSMWACDYISTRTLEIREWSEVVEFNEGTRALMARAECLLLTGGMSWVHVTEMDPKGFPELKHLNVGIANEIEYIAMKNYNGCMFPKLETLYLNSLHKLKRICDDHLLPIRSFENLRVINVERCGLLNHFFSSNLARGLVRLKEIRVKECESMESIVVSREIENEEVQIGFTHQLRVLKLCGLPRLVSFYHRLQHSEELPSPTILFNKKIMFSKLDVLKLNHIEVEKIWDDHPRITAEGTYWFQNLTSLKVSKCDKLSNLFTNSMVKSFTQLQKLTIRYCDSIEEIVATMEGDELLLFPKLESLELYYLPKLNRFCHADLLKFQSLQTLKIEGCPMLNTFMGANHSSLFDEKIVFPKLKVLMLCLMKIEKIWDFEHLAIAAKETTCWFQNFTILTVSHCHNLSYLFTYSMAKTLTKLKHLDVRDCQSIKEIVASTETITTEETQLSFPMLDDMEFYHLPNLTRFCNANLLECRVLRKLSIRRCSKLKTFMGANDSSNSDSSTTLFPEKVAFPNIEKMDIYACDSLEKVFGIQVLPMNEIETCRNVQNLTSLVVSCCANLSFLFTSSMVKSLAQLEQLRVDSCESIEEIVAPHAADMQLSFPKLDMIELKVLPKLKRFCHANLLECQALLKLVIQDCPELKTFMSTNGPPSSSDTSTTLFTEKVAFPNIKELEIYGLCNFKMLCENQLHPNSFSRLKILLIGSVRDLLCVFTPSMLRRAADLEVLLIANCDSLEKVYDIEALSMNECGILPFQNLKSLDVSDCPSLTSIFSVPILQQLVRLVVLKCDKIDWFGFKHTQQQSMDAFAKLISNLDCCNLDIGGGLSLEYSRDETLKLKIVGCGFQVPPILSALLNIFKKLHRVEVSRNSVITQLFSCEPDHLDVVDGDDIDTRAKTLVRIGLLRLTKLSNMKHIWSENCPLKYHWNPEDLQVAQCDNLLSLAPASTTLFRNLRGLVVWGCPILKLVASSKSLVNLERMAIVSCDSLEEIVGIDDQLASTGDYIVFEKLVLLKLRHLNTLTSFCSTSSCNFQFPSLNRLVVENCPKMQFFTKGPLSTPGLINVSKDEHEREGRWEGDLNSTIRQLFREKESMKELEALQCE